MNHRTTTAGEKENQHHRHGSGLSSFPGGNFKTREDGEPMSKRADDLLPYRIPSNIVGKYGTRQEKQELIELLQKVNKQIADWEQLDAINDRLEELRAISERRFLEDTLRGDFELFKELVKRTAQAVTLEQALQFDINMKLSDAEKLELYLGIEMNSLLIASLFYGWESVTDETGEPLIFSAISERVRHYFPDWNPRRAGTAPGADQSDDAQKPPKKRKAGQIHISARPESYIFPLDTVTYNAFEGLLESANYGGQLQPLRMFTKLYKLPDGRKKPGKPVCVFAIMECKGADFSQPLDVIDGAILRGIYSLLDAGETRFTLSHVWGMIAGAGQKTNKSRLEDMCARVRRMIATTAKISYKQYADESGLEYTDDIIAQILPGVKVRERRNARGEIVEAELFCQLPLENFPLYQFAELTGQITRLPIEAATVRGEDVNGKAQKLTDYRLIIRELMLRRIEKQHHSKSDQVIRLEGLRDDPGLYDRVNATDTQQQYRVREAAENFLCEWGKLGRIYAYAWRKKGKLFDAILIANSPDEMKNHPGAEWLTPWAK